MSNPFNTNSQTIRVRATNSTTSACYYESIITFKVADLPEAFRTTIILREIEGMAYEEIAEMTGVSLGTVKSRIARARAKLQSVLQPYFTEG